jgi:predicted nucleic acid-binding protein
MTVVLDTNMLLLLLDPKLPAPKDKNGQPVADRVNERISYLVAELQRQHEKIIIPAPVLAEVLVRAGQTAGAEYLSRLSNAAAFRIEPFDARCACEVAAMTTKAIGGGNKSGGSTEPWQKVKYDRQIVATAKVQQCTMIYTDDAGVIAIAKTSGITTTNLAALPLPPEDAQLPLPWSLPADEAPPPAD